MIEGVGLIIFILLLLGDVFVQADCGTDGKVAVGLNEEQSMGEIGCFWDGEGRFVEKIELAHILCVS
jgi:hypothetical protein